MQIEDIAGTVDALRRLGVRVVLIGQSPIFPFEYPEAYLYSSGGAQQPGLTYEAPLDAAPDINDRMSAAARADVFFDPLALLCRRAQCVLKERGLYLFADHGHYTDAGSIRVVAALLSQLRNSTPTGSR